MIGRPSPSIFACILCVLLSGCGGGGSSLPSIQSKSAPAVTPASTPQSVTVALRIPAVTSAASAATRRPQYVSVNTQSATIAVNGGTPVAANLAVGSPNCTAATGGGRTCTISISAPIGTDTFAENLYASTNGTGAVLSQNTTSATITAGQANTVNLVLDGVVASIALSLATTAPPIGTPATIPLTVNINDASNATIIGSDPLANPITLTDSDTSGATTLSKTTLSTPADATGITVKYNGNAIQSAVFGATATGVPASSVTSAKLTPSSPASTAFVDWPTYAYDSQRSGFNPNSTAITPSSVSSLHLAWQASAQGDTTQPIVVTGVAGHAALVIVGSYVTAVAYDAQTGVPVWSTDLPKQDVQACGTAGISGTVQYDAALGSLFMVAGNGGGAPNHAVLYKLSAATGQIQSSVDVTPTLEPGEANTSHAGVSFANGRIYVGTGSNCEGSSPSAYPSWRGRVVSVDPASMTVLSTFFTTWGQGGNYGGGGLWAWGGVSADPSGNIYLSSGNAETNNSVNVAIQPPFALTTNEQAGYAEHLVKLSGDLSTVYGSNYPGFNFSIGGQDLDYVGVPVVFQPPGCGVLTATQGKGGTLVINNASTVAEVQSFALSVPSAKAYYMGNAAYSPTTGYLYAPITSSGNGSSMLPPGLAAITGCGTSMAWNAQFGPDSASFTGDNPRSAPTVTAGGVVLLGTPYGAGGTATGAIWAIDASAGTVLGGGQPILQTHNSIRMPPTADGQWVYVYDTGGNLYALTTDPNIQSIAVKRGNTTQSTYRYSERNN
jgi:hypothetical protein